MRVVDVSPAGRSDVYDLAVEDPVHAFAVNGGVLVSNCYDALRYLVAHLEQNPGPGPGVEAEPLAGSPGLHLRDPATSTVTGNLGAF